MNQTRQKEERNDSSQDEGTDGKRSDRRSPSQRLVDFVRRTLDNPSIRPRALGCAVSLIVLAISYRRRKDLCRLLASGLRRQSYLSATQAPLSLVYRSSREGLVERALLCASGVFFLSEGVWRKASLPPNSPEIQKELLATLTATCDNVEALPESLASRLLTPLLAALPFVYLAFVYRMIQGLNGKESGLAKSYPQSSVATTFRDVAGLDDVVVEVAEVVKYLKAPNEYSRLGANVPRGILLYGPPGSGKTLLAQAIAGEACVDCFLACSASDFVEIYVGRGAARVRSLFAQIREHARSKHQSWWSRWFGGSVRAASCRRRPTAILFVDELDALAKTRSQWSSNDEREQTLNQLLTEMDGFDSQKAADNGDDVTVIVMAASNRADVLDPAILRRFDRQVFVGYPDAAGRCSILQTHARRIQWDRQSVDWEALAGDDHTPTFSGSDIRNLINESAILAVREGSKSVKQRHLEHAARRIREMKVNLKGSRPALPLSFLQ